jgi:tetratricopeptide (TPR) repeat protein
VTLNLERPDGSVAWGDTVEGPARDLFELQTRLATILADAIADQTPSAERAAPAAPITSSEPAQIAYWKGRALLDRRDLTGNLQGALTEFASALTADPKFAIAHAGLAEAQWQMYLQTNDKAWAERAMEATREALKLEPDRPSVRYIAALTLYRSGQYASAEEEVGRALALQPTFEDAIRLRGTILARIGRVDEAMTEFDRLMAIRPNSVSLYTDKGLALYNAARYQEALPVFEKAIALSPSSAISLARAGAAAHALGDLKRALDYYERANSIQARAETLSSMGTIYYSLGEPAQAAKAYEAALLIRPLGATTHRNLGDAYQRLGRKDDALKAYRQAVKLADAEVTVSPGDARAIARLGVYQAKSGDAAAASASLKRALGLAPKDEQVLFRAGIIHALAGRANEALDALEQAVAGGYARRLIADEEDLAVLRSMPRFAAMVSTPAEVTR